MTGSPLRRLLAAAAVALAALAAAGCQPVQVNSSSGSSSQSNTTDGEGHTDKSSYQLDQQVSAIQLDGNAGDVRLIAGDGPVSVTETARYTDDKPPTSHTVNGATLTLTAGECEHERTVNGRCEVDWEIHAPAATALTLTGGAGDIVVTGFSGTLSAKSGSGDVKAKQLTSRSATARTSAGDVQLDFSQPPDQVKATSSAGSVHIQLPTGTGYDVQAHSSTGDPNVDVTQDRNSPHKIEARTSAGSVEVSSP